MDYNKTLNLPQTDFPMRAGLPVREPEILKFWESNRISEKVRESRKGKKKRILHDGPPYSNGKIHLGQTFNKILKDMVVKFWTLRGFDSPYVPGWDTHGLPNELEAIKTFKINRKAIEPLELRKKCRESALHYVDVQRDQFKRLGIDGIWEKPYLTLDHTYEAAIVRAFGDMAEKGYIYRDKKSVYWCITCETSLAEAEIEYKDKSSPSIYVKFSVKDGKLFEALSKNVKNASAFEAARKGKTSVLIWTTTPWTLPGNVAISLHPAERYSLFSGSDGEFYFFADKLQSKVEEAAGLKFEPVASVQGKEASGSSARHPFLDRDSKLIHQDYVTMEDGTGAVHTAPGHGQDDFMAAKFFDLPIIVPVDGRGFLTEEAGRFAGISILDANTKIPEYLKETGHLLALGTIQHSYPHCWRCHNPIIFRATEQWFVAIDHRDLRKRTLETLPKIKWFPAWGEERMQNMVSSRPDWCISRQRTWGVPIPVFYCESCKKSIYTPESIGAVEKLFLKEGADSWYAHPALDILPNGFLCPHCKSKSGFRKEMDIFDVWFESGVSHLAVLETRPELEWPSQLYLEGPDQYRGWFQVSLLSAMAIKEKSPYHDVLTHGWTLDEQGRAMHKSLGNAIDPMDILKNYGADILRLLFASMEFKNDVRIGDKVFKDVSEAYRKIRNTFRFLIGNLYDFNPEKNSVKPEQMREIDRWALLQLQTVYSYVLDYYERYDFHFVYQQLLSFCINDLSSVYLDLLKDRLYTFLPDSIERRSAQTVLYEILMKMVTMLFPILSFTAEEIWQTLPTSFKNNTESVALSEFPPKPDPNLFSGAFRDRWRNILLLREKVYAKMEEARSQKVIRQPLEASVTIRFSDEEFAEYEKDIPLLEELFIVSKLNLVKEPRLSDIQVEVVNAGGQKCARCWHYYDELSGDPYPGLCHRCLPVVQKIVAHTI